MWTIILSRVDMIVLWMDFSHGFGILEAKTRPFSFSAAATSHWNIHWFTSVRKERVHEVLPIVCLPRNSADESHAIRSTSWCWSRTKVSAVDIQLYLICSTPSRERISTFCMISLGGQAIEHAHSIVEERIIQNLIIGWLSEPGQRCAVSTMLAT